MTGSLRSLSFSKITLPKLGTKEYIVIHPSDWIIEYLYLGEARVSKWSLFLYKTPTHWGLAHTTIQTLSTTSHCDPLNPVYVVMLCAAPVTAREWLTTEAAGGWAGVLCPHLQQTRPCLNLLQQPSIHITCRFLEIDYEWTRPKPKTKSFKGALNLLPTCGGLPVLGMQKSCRRHSQWSSLWTTLLPAHRGHGWGAASRER